MREMRVYGSEILIRGTMRKLPKLHKPQVVVFRKTEFWVICCYCFNDWPCPDWEAAHTVKLIRQQKKWVSRVESRDVPRKEN